MAYIKQNFKDGDVLTAEQLNHMEDGIAQASANNQSGGMTEEQIRNIVVEEIRKVLGV